MAKSIKILLVFFLFKLIFSLSYCCKQEFGFRYISMQLVNLDNTSNLPIESNDSSIKASAYGIRAKFENQLYYSYRYPEIYSSAYATSCNVSFALKSPLLSVDIFTLNDFDSTHLTGSNVTNYFLGRNSINSNENYSLVSDLLGEINNQKMDEDDFKNAFDFFLIKKPTLDSLFQFEINFVFQDTILTEKTDSLILRSY